MKNVKLLVVSLLTMIALVSCDLFSPAVVTEKNLFGRIMNARTMDYAAITADTNVTIRLIYADEVVEADVEITEAADDELASVMYYATVPGGVGVVEVIVEGFVTMVAETNNTNPLKDIYLYPAETVDEDRTYQLVDTDERAIVTAGNFVAQVSSITGGDFANPYQNQTISGTITDGTFTIPAADQIKGATYYVRVLDVDGYEDNNFSFIAGSAVTENDFITMTNVDAGSEALRIIATDYIDDDATIIDGKTSVSLTFNKTIELHPLLVGNYVSLVSITNIDDADGDGNPVAYSVADVAEADTTSYTVNGTFSVSNRNTITLSTDKKTITITAITTALNSESTVDDYSFVYELSDLRVREEGSTDAYAQPIYRSGGAVTDVISDIRNVVP